MRVQTKLTSLLLLLIVIVSAGRFLYQNFENSQVGLMFDQIAQRESSSLNKIISLKGASLDSFVKDYTYWDEMVDFVRTGDMNWAVQMLDTSLDTYDASRLWVYKTDLSLLYSVNNAGERSAEGLSLPNEALSNLFAIAPLCHFFLNTPSGLMEVRGGTIHPTEDVERKTPPRGYFFSGRLWDNEYTSELAELSGGTVALTAAQQQDSAVKVLPEKSMVMLSKPLTGWDGRTIAYVNVRISSKEMANYTRFSKNTMFIFVIFAVSILVFIMLYLTFSVSMPFKFISQALNRENTEYLRRLEKGEDEFGDISRLIHNFFQQKEELVRENAERRKAEEAIKKAYQTTRDILEKSPLGICVVNTEGNIEYVNPAMMKMSGDTHDRLKSLNIFEISPYKESGISDKIKSTFCGGYFSEKAVRSVSPSSGQSVIRNFLGMPFEEDGRSKSLIFVEDITELKKLEEIKDSLTHMIIHDLSNPLTAMSGELQLLRLASDGKFSETQNSSLEAALNATRDLKRMTANLMDISKMEDGKIRLNPERFHLGDVAREVIDQMKVVAFNTNKVLASEIADGMPAVSADKEIIRRVIANLVANALKFTSARGSILLSVFEKAEQEHIYVSVKDNGCGIPREYLPRIFDKFFQIEAQVKTGYGLGLTFCKMMVEAHGGKIWAESEGMGKGTTITFALPVGKK